MSHDAVIEVISKALADAEFRAQLFSEPESALSEFDLSDDERENLSSLKEEALEAFSSEIEDRISKSGVYMNVPYAPQAPSYDEMVNVEQIFRAELDIEDVDRLLGG